MRWQTLGHPPGLFSADKVWTDATDGPAQIAETARRWGVERFDLLQVHNLIDWEAQSGHPRRHEGGRRASLRRRHHLARTPPRGTRRSHAPPAARFRAAHLQRRGPGGGTAPAAARTGARDRRHLQPPVPARPLAGPARRATDARLGVGDRGVHLAAIPAQVHRLAPRGHGRHPGDAAGGARAGEQVRRPSAPCRTKPCASVWPSMCEACRAVPRAPSDARKRTTR